MQGAVVVINQSSLDTIVFDEVLTEGTRQQAVDKVLRENQMGKGSELCHEARSGLYQKRAEQSGRLNSKAAEMYRSVWTELKVHEKYGRR